MRIIYTDAQGRLCVVSPVNREDMSEEELLEYIIAKDIPKDVPYKIIREEDIPLDREFRDAWCDVTEANSIDMDMDKVKGIQLKKLRAHRNTVLDQTDKELMIKLENNDNLTTLKQRRQQLRDATAPLKNLNCVNKYNDTDLLIQIKELGTLHE